MPPTKLPEYCPECGSTEVVKGVLGDWDFTEKGWHRPQRMHCKNPKCNHSWSENVIGMKGGTLFEYGK